jgi:hypothetical protein
MLSNFSQFSPQGLAPQFPGVFPGFQAVGPTQFSPPVFGQPGPFGGSSAFGYDGTHIGAGQQQYPFAAPPGWLAQNPFAAFATNPYNVQGQLVPVLGHVAQQIAQQSAVTQQLGIVLQQLAHQLGVHGLQTPQAFGLGGAQPYGIGMGVSGQPFGFNPQTPAWAASRPQTIQ